MFLPIHLVALPQTFTLKVGETRVINITTYPQISTQVTVMATPNNQSVRLGGGVAGVPFYGLKVNPPPASPASLFVTGVDWSGSALVYLEAWGTQIGIFSVVVNKK